MQCIEKDTQIKSFLKTGKSKKKIKVAGVPGLYLVKNTETEGIWEFTRMRDKQRFHFMRRYPKCSLSQARSIFNDYNLKIDRGDPYETISPRHLQAEKKKKIVEGVKIDSLIVHYFEEREERLKKSKTNKNPDRELMALQARYKKYLRDEIGELFPSQLTTEVAIRVLSQIRNSDSTRSKVQALLSDIKRWAIRTNRLSIEAAPINWEMVHEVLPRSIYAPQKHPACKVEDIPELVKLIYEFNPHEAFKAGAYALLFVILTGVRVGCLLEPDSQVCGDGEDWFAHWKEVDLKQAIWHIPAQYLKESQNGAMDIPLSKQAIFILEKQKELIYSLMGNKAIKGDSFLFPSTQFGRVNRINRPMKASSLKGILRRVDEKQKALGLEGFRDRFTGKMITTHGFRSTLTDWAEKEGFNSDLVEIQLHHRIKGVRGHYLRDPQIERRREMLERWGDYCFSLLSLNKDIS